MAFLVVGTIGFRIVHRNDQRDLYFPYEAALFPAVVRSLNVFHIFGTYMCIGTNVADGA